MVREYWKDVKGYMVYLSSDEENKELINTLWNKCNMTYYKKGQPFSHHFKVSEKQLKKLPIDTFKLI